MMDDVGASINVVAAKTPWPCVPSSPSASAKSPRMSQTIVPSSVREATPAATDMRELDSQEIRVLALVLSLLAFFFFIAAEIVPQQERTVVLTLVALATLGFAWIGPLTLLAGSIKSPKFKWWQPFQGGAEFVWMQAFGWSLQTLALTGAVVLLANNNRMDEHSKWVEGQYLLLGIIGFVAQLLLNLSIGVYNDDDVEEEEEDSEDEAEAVGSITKRKHHKKKKKKSMMTKKKKLFPWDAKAIVSMLVSVSAAMLFVVFDLYAHRLQSTAVIIAGCVEFTLSAVVIHVFYGCKDIPGYRMWQPFEGERLFLLMQYLGWQFFVGTVVGTLMLCVSTDFQSSPSVVRGAPTAVGVMGMMSQIILLASLQHFKPSPTEETESSISDAAARSVTRPPEVYVSALLCSAALAVGCASYIARRDDVVMFAAWWQVYRLHEKIFWVISMLALGIASPIAHLGAVRAYPEYSWWQPFIGGTKFVFLQTLGWFWYGFFAAGSMLLLLNDSKFAELAAPFALVVGCAATGAMILSLPYFCATAPVTTVAPSAFSAITVVPSPMAAEKATARQYTRQLALQRGEIAISLMLTMSSIVCHAVADYFRSEIQEQATAYESSLRSVALALGTMLYCLGCFISHASGWRIFEDYRLWQPFEGGPQFVVRQAIGWTLVGLQLLFDSLIISVPAQSLPLGLVTGIGVVGAVPHLVLISSLRYFRSSRVSRRCQAFAPTPPVSPRIHAAPKNTSWKVLLQRPDLRLLLWVDGFTTFGALALFVSAHLCHKSERFRHADAVLYAFGFAVSVGAILFTHVGLGPRVQPGYKWFQPFLGGLQFITFQGVAWTLASVAWVACCTALHWRHVFFQFQAIHVLTGLVLLTAQCILLYSLPLFKPPQTTITSSCPAWLRVRLSKLGRFTHDFSVGPLLGMTACVAFVLVDISMFYWGPSLPVFPITVCAVVALLSAIPMSYKFAQSAMGQQAKALGGNMLFLVLGSALWSFTILLGALFCCRVWGLEDRTSPPTVDAAASDAPPRTLSTSFMGTFTGMVGFFAQLVFLRASEAKKPFASPKGLRLSGAAAARAAARRAKDHLISASIWLYSCAAVATAFVCAYTTSFKAARPVPTHQLTSMMLCSLAVIGCAYWIQRQIVHSSSATMYGNPERLTMLPDREHPHYILSDAALVQLESDAFAQIAAFLTVAELIRMSSTCQSFQAVHDEAFWRRQFFDRFARNVAGKRAAAVLPMPPKGPVFVSPFASRWITLFEDRLLNAVCRLELNALTSPDIDQSSSPPGFQHRSRASIVRHKWRTMCISRENKCSCDQCALCGKLEILTESSHTWESRQKCSLRVPSTWIRLCHCMNETTLTARRAHRACLEKFPGIEFPLCPTCLQAPQPSVRYPHTLQELRKLTWADFRTGREDFAGGFFSFVPMAVTLVVLSARSFQFGCFSLYVWVCYAMAICFVSNTPRISLSLERIGGDESSLRYTAYQRLVHALTMPSLGHVLWCLATSPLGVLDVVLGVNFAVLAAFATALLVLYWRSSYLVPTFQSCAPAPVDEAFAATAGAVGEDAQNASCIACLLELCSPDQPNL